MASVGICAHCGGEVRLEMYPTAYGPIWGGECHNCTHWLNESGLNVAPVGHAPQAQHGPIEHWLVSWFEEDRGTRQKRVYSEEALDHFLGLLNEPIYVNVQVEPVYAEGE